MYYKYYYFLLSFLTPVLFFFLAPLSTAQTVLEVEVWTGSYEYVHIHPTQYGDFIAPGDTLAGYITFDYAGNRSEIGTGCIKVTGFDIVVISDPADSTDCPVDIKITRAIKTGAEAVILVQDYYPINYEDLSDTLGIPVFIGSGKDFNHFPKDIFFSTKIYYKYDSSENVLWGDKPGEGDFADGLGGWTTVGVTSDTALWQYEADAQSNGEKGKFLIDSPTKGNGAALLDNEVYLSAGDGLPTAPPYGDVGSQLISPIIDLTEKGPFIVKWYQYCIPLNTVNPDNHSIHFYYSLDGGESWIKKIPVKTETEYSMYGSAHNPEIRRVFIPETTGLSDFRFKIEFRAGLYAMLIDDVQVVEAADNNLIIVEQATYPIEYYAQPSFSFQYDTMHFSAMVKNESSQTQDNISIKVELINEATDQVFYTLRDIDKTVSIPIGEIRRVSLGEKSINLALPSGTYSIRYTIIPENADEFPADNSIAYTFVVTDNLFAMSQAYPSGRWSVEEDKTIAAGNLYKIPAVVYDKYIISGIQTCYMPDSPRPTEDVTILISSIPDSLNDDIEDLSLNNSLTPFQLELIEPLAYSEISTQGKSSGDLLTTERNDFIDVQSKKELAYVPLENGTAYILWVIVSDRMLGIPFHSGQAVLKKAFHPILYLPDSTGNLKYTINGARDGRQAIIQLKVALKTTVDKSPLPETSMKVFPNPVTAGKIKAVLQFGKPTDATITIAGMDGLVHSINVYKNVVNRTIVNDVSDLPAGTYLIRLATDEGTKTMKFIKL